MPAEVSPPTSEGKLPFDTNPISPPNANNALYGNVKQKSYIVECKGNDRAVTVFKQRGSRKHANDIFDLDFQQESVDLLKKHFQEHPPSPSELQAAAEGLTTDPAHLHTLSAELSTVALATDGGSLLVDSPEGHRRIPRKRKAGVKSAASFTPQQVEARWQAYQAKLARPDMQQLSATRASLPIASYRQQILDAVSGNQVVLISGETGCGKTTQVPQYLLDRAWEQGQACRLLCTQPRRISAVSVADRVATERGEAPGDTVGYTIRLESKGGPHSSLMFCTNGVLLRMLTSGDGLEGVTHIVVDEIHERDKFADFLLIMLRDLLPSKPHLHLVLMSATLNVALFTDYFHGCPLIQVPGYTYPVQDFYLEDVLKFIGYKASDNYTQDSHDIKLSNGEATAPLTGQQKGVIEQAIMDAFLKGDEGSWERLLEVTGAQEGAGNAACLNVAHQATGATALMAAAGKGRLHELSMLLAAGAKPELQSKGGTAREWALRFGHTEAAEMLQLHEEAAEAADAAAGGAANSDADEVDLFLIVTLIKYICGEPPYNREEEGGLILGAVLVFLPGWDEIIRLKEQLEGLACFRSQRYQLLPLHSMVPTQDQRKVFIRPPPGVRKLILATNIAETAVTIDDIVCVINSGRLKEKSYDPYTGVSTLQAAWVSRASEKQRRGRAGRCQPGVAFHCYSRTRSQALAELQLPELKRSPLDELCLQVKLLEGAASGPSVASFLGRAVEPPVDAAVRNALRLLEDIGAIQEGSEALTKLGRHLAALPLPPRVGKMLLFGVMFGCLDPVLTVACCMAYRDPWVLPVEAGARQAAIRAKQGLAQGAGGASDHLALVKAFNGWSAARRAGQERGYCSSNFLSSSTMMMVNGMRTQLLGELQVRGLVESLASASMSAADGGLVRSVLACGFYPLVGRLLPVKGNQGGPRSKATIITAKDEKVRIHPSSINSQLSVPDSSSADYQDCPIILFEEITRGEAQLYVRQCTLAKPHALLLVAAHLALSQEDTQHDDPTEGQHVRYTDDGEVAAAAATGSDDAIVTVDGWLQLRLPLQHVAHICCLRHRLTQAFAAKVQASGPLTNAHHSALDVISQVLSMEAAAGAGGSGDLGTSHMDSAPYQGFSQRGRGRGSGGRGRFGSNAGTGHHPAGNGRQQPHGRGQLYEPPQHAHRQTGGYGGQGRIQQPSQPQLNRHGYDGHAPQQHSGEQHQGHLGGRGRGPPRGRHAGMSRGRGF
ncbi:MAG: putative ATP-dependent RNA helicase DHX36-like [Trebouxia sp. A1-2]|nr:MAG: putative ATP-dependent RNA helicase DHX36-like [Trebouxia sp. A1-2]